MAERRQKKEENTVDTPQETDPSTEQSKSVVPTDVEEPEAENLYIGQCVGGPMDGQQGESRFPKGFVLIDRPNSAAWVYDYNVESSTFTEREQNVHDKERVSKAA